jgi:hypothetical protein
MRKPKPKTRAQSVHLNDAERAAIFDICNRSGRTASELLRDAARRLIASDPTAKKLHDRALSKLVA